MAFDTFDLFFSFNAVTRAGSGVPWPSVAAHARYRWTALPETKVP